MRHLVTLVTFASLASAPATSRAAQPQPQRPLLVRRQPAYPELARRMHISGDVPVRLNILPDGRVEQAHAEGGHALLRQAAEDAVRLWRFAPARASSSTIVTVSFRHLAN